MAASGRMRDTSMQFGIIMAVALFASCTSPDEPELDRTPPPTPEIALLRAAVPDAQGFSRISGAPGAVEADTEVEVRQSAVAAPLSSRTRASADGSFEVQLRLGLLELLEVVATDDAGNSSPAAVLATGSPFLLIREGEQEQEVIAGDSLQSALSVVLHDESGAPTPGVLVSFTTIGLNPSELEIETDVDGRAVWSFVAPTLAAEMTLRAALTSAMLAEAVDWSLSVRPAAAEDLLAVAGSEQIGDSGTTLHDALQVRVVDAYGNGVPGVEIDWSTLLGSLSSASDSTDSTGTSRVFWTLPGIEGEYEATATASALGPISALFVGVAGGPPVVHSYSPDPAVPGSSISIAGERFSRAAAYNEVFFSGSSGALPGILLEVDADLLVVEVPVGATSGELNVRVCGRDAASTSLRVAAELGVPVDVPVGGDPVRLETPSGNEEFVLVLYSDANTATSYSIGSNPAAAAKFTHPASSSAEESFHAWLRQRERELRFAPRVQPTLSTAKPLVESTFTVLASLSGSSYESVTASLRYQGTRILLYVDQRVQSSELSESQIQALGSKFDKSGGSYAVVTSAFGDASDINSDNRVAVLLTPTVNMLTPPGSGAFVGGFFFSQDLHAVPNSNSMEILYGMVPDPTGRWGNVFPVAQTLDVLDGVLPHELQHLVSYTEHVLQRSGEPEELWLNESLSHLAEDLAQIREQNVLRANLFLDEPYLVSLTQGGNELAERGMGFLFVRYLADHEDSGFLGRLVETTRTGRDNIENASGRSFGDWMADWAATLYLDHSGLGAATYRYTSLDFADDFEAPHLGLLSLQNPSAGGTLPTAGCRFYKLSGTGSAHTDLEVEGDVRALVIRTR